MVVPEECPSRQEAIELLKDPQALWAVLKLNCPSYSSAQNNIVEHLTSVSQYTREVVACLSVRHAHAQSIFTFLKLQIQEKDDNILFDDDMFSKSCSYHRIIKTCHLVTHSISSSIRFVQRFRETQIAWLCAEAHSSEAHGIAHWKRQLSAEVAALEDLAHQITSFRETVQEDRNALHGATAVLQARLALQQGERMQTLTYLATAYLPLATVASIYSMIVLPSPATLASFFVIFIVFMLMTLLCGISFSKARIKLASNARGTRSYKAKFRVLLGLFEPVQEYLRFYVDILTPGESKAEHSGEYTWADWSLFFPLELAVPPMWLLHISCSTPLLLTSCSHTQPH